MSKNTEPFTGCFALVLRKRLLILGNERFALVFDCSLTSYNMRSVRPAAQSCEMLRSVLPSNHSPA